MFILAGMSPLVVLLFSPLVRLSVISEAFVCCVLNEVVVVASIGISLPALSLFNNIILLFALPVLFVVVAVLTGDTARFSSATLLLTNHF